MNPNESDESLIPPDEEEGRVYQAPNGKWGFVIEVNGAEVVRQGSYDDEDEAREDMGEFMESYWTRAFVAKMYAEGGYVGEDEQGRLVRTLPGGGVEVIEEAKS